MARTRRSNDGEESSNGEEEAEFHDVDCVVWDEASEARKPKKDIPQTKFTMVAEPGNPNIINIVSPQGKKSDARKDDGKAPAKRELFKASDKEDGYESSDSTKLLGAVMDVASPTKRFKFDQNRAVVVAEHLSGGLLSIVVNVEGSQDGAFVIQGVIATNKHLPPFETYQMFAAQVAVGPNSNRARVNSCNSYTKNAFIAVKQKCPKLQVKGGLRSLLVEVARYLNHHTYTTAEGLVSEVNFTKYEVPPVEDVTEKKKRKLGDAITLNKAIEFGQRLNSDICGPRVFHTHQKFIEMYFNPPYPKELQEAFGFPDGCI
jgi:hypothetical protein